MGQITQQSTRKLLETCIEISVSFDVAQLQLATALLLVVENSGLSFGELSKLVPISRSSLSRHLQYLREGYGEVAGLHLVQMAPHADGIREGFVLTDAGRAVVGRLCRER